MKTKYPCDCGCGKKAYHGQFQFFRAPDGRSYNVLPGCLKKFKAEAQMFVALDETVEKVMKKSVFVRWMYAYPVFALQVKVNTRRYGSSAAVSAAKRSVWMLCLPRWAAMKLARIWK